MTNFVLIIFAICLVPIIYWYFKIIEVTYFNTKTFNENSNNRTRTILSIISIICILGFVIFKVNKSKVSSRNSNVEISQEKSLCGPGDASCETNVRNHINGINGVELNFISYIQNNDGSPSGKFQVGVLKQDERGINQFSATITTDCNCNVIDAGGIVRH